MDYDYAPQRKGRGGGAHYVITSTTSMINTLYKFKCEQQHHEHNHDYCHTVGNFYEYGQQHINQ